MSRLASVMPLPAALLAARDRVVTSARSPRREGYPVIAFRDLSCHPALEGAAPSRLKEAAEEQLDAIRGLIDVGNCALKETDLSYTANFRGWRESRGRASRAHFPAECEAVSGGAHKSRGSGIWFLSPLKIAGLMCIGRTSVVKLDAAWGRLHPMTIRDRVGDEVLRIARLLRAVLELSKVSEREVERQLEMGGGTLNRLFTGRIELKVGHLLAILDVIDMRPERFFQLAAVLRETVSDSGESLGRQVLDALEKLAPMSPASERQVAALEAMPDDELDRRISEALLRLGIQPVSAVKRSPARRQRKKPAPRPPRTASKPPRKPPRKPASTRRRS